MSIDFQAFSAIFSVPFEATFYAWQDDVIYQMSCKFELQIKLSLNFCPIFQKLFLTQEWKTHSNYWLLLDKNAINKSFRNSEQILPSASPLHIQFLQLKSLRIVKIKVFLNWPSLWLLFAVDGESWRKLNLVFWGNVHRATLSHN